MSYGSIRTPPLSRSRHFPRTGTTTPPISSSRDEATEYFTSRRHSVAFDGLNKRAKRGKSPHDILNRGEVEGVISSDERSGRFEGIPIDEKEIGRLPKKVSPAVISLGIDSLLRLMTGLKGQEDVADR